MIFSTVDVAGAQPYRIQIGSGLLHDSALLAPLFTGSQPVIISDDTVWSRYGPALSDALPTAQTFTFPAGEPQKSLSTFTDALHFLAEHQIRRDDTIVALGGGVPGDLAGFVAACWMRGIRCVQMPTTLLAMVDSSVGGKTAVDLPHGKNLVGAFHPPSAVLIDVDTLQTLPAREFAAGMAEVVKYGAIFSSKFCTELAELNVSIENRDAEVMARIIQSCCQFKASVVERDLYEHGERALLNFGHTFGHAIETVDGYSGRFNHGEAVSVGMILAGKLSTELGLAPATEWQQLRELLLSFDLPVELPSDLDPHALLSAMSLDKKATANGLRCILWHGIGSAFVQDKVPTSSVLKVLTT